MPITIRIPTQQQLAQMQQDPNSLLAMYNAANAASVPKATTGSLAPANAPGISPGSVPSSPTVVSPVPTPTPIAKPQIDYTPQNNADWIKATSDMINQINMQAQQAANAARIPGGAGLEAKSSANINSALSGVIPNDVYTQMAQRSAERGVMSGSPMGANSTADIMRALGLTSLQLQGTGQDWLTAATARNPAAPIFDPSKLLITPTQATGFGLEQANFELAQQRQQTEIANANAQRQLQSDLANASNQLERDKLVWQYEQNRLNRENALKLAQMEAASKAAGYGRGAGGGGSSQYGGFNPATNWAGAGYSTPLNQPWNLPYNLGNTGLGTTTGSEWTPGTYTDTMNPLYGYTQEPGLPNTVPGTTWTPPTADSWDNLLPGYEPYSPPGGINTGGMTQEELDWLYNVGG